MKRSTSICLPKCLTLFSTFELKLKSPLNSTLNSWQLGVRTRNASERRFRFLQWHLSSDLIRDGWRRNALLCRPLNPERLLVLKANRTAEEQIRLLCLRFDRSPLRSVVKNHSSPVRALKAAARLSWWSHVHSSRDVSIRSNTGTQLHWICS